MEKTANVELTKEKNLMELLDLLRKNNMKEAANRIFEMARNRKEKLFRFVKGMKLST